MRGEFFRRHSFSIIGAVFWILAIATILFFPRINLFRRTCESCNEYSRFVDALSPYQKSKLVLFEAGVISVADRFFYLGESSNDESDLIKSDLISYKKLSPFIDEKVRRLIIINSLLDSMSADDRNLILNKKAAILYRNGDFVLIHGKAG